MKQPLSKHCFQQPELPGFWGASHGVDEMQAPRAAQDDLHEVER